MHREYHRWFSPRLQRDMELLVFGHGGAPVIVFPTRSGRFYDYENWGMVNALSQHLERGWLQLYCLDSVDAEGLYSTHKSGPDKVARHVCFEQYVLEEVLPLARSLNSHRFLISHGCSIGAYHAVNIAFRHPHLFGKVVALSGRYDLTQAVGDFPDLFSGYYDEAIYFHTPSHFIPNLRDESILCRLRAMEIILAIGEKDAFYEGNVRLSRSLWEIGVWNALHVWPGKAHKPAAWQLMCAAYL